MDTLVSAILQHMDHFVLMFIRVTALIVSSPIFGRRNIPTVAKMGLCLAITYIVFSAQTGFAPLQAQGVLPFALLCAKELLFGIVIAYCTQAFFTLVQTAGHSIDMQMGFGMVNVFDVQNNISVPVSGNLLYIILTMMFFALNAHHQLLYILLSTFRNVPVGQVTLNPAVGMAALEVFVLTFVMAINVAMPFVASGLLAEITLGFIVRTTPQMNVFVVGMPLKVLLGLSMLIVIAPVYARYSSVIFENMFSAIDYMLRGLAGAV